MKILSQNEIKIVCVYILENNNIDINVHIHVQYMYRYFWDRTRRHEYIDMFGCALNIHNVLLLLLLHGTEFFSLNTSD